RIAGAALVPRVDRARSGRDSIATHTPPRCRVARSIAAAEGFLPMERHAVLALYRPHPNQALTLRERVARHAPLLRRLGLLADAPAVLMQTDAGTCIEIFRWRSPEAAREADTRPEVRQLWQDMSRISDSPAIDANPEPPTDRPRFIPVVLPPRSPEA